MALLDERAEFCSPTPLNTGAPGTYNIGDVIDMRNTTTDRSGLRDGAAEAWWCVRVSTTCTSGGAAFAQFRLVSDDTGAPSTSTASVHAGSGPIPVASLVAGTIVCAIPLMGLRSLERYLGLQQITTGAAFTGGAIHSFISSTPPTRREYADNVA